MLSIKIIQIDLGCGFTPYEVITSGAKIASPNYPNNHPDNSICANVIKFEKGRVIELSFLQFELYW